MARKCSRDDCPTQNIASDITVYCHRCKGIIHLLCYGIEKNPEEIFLTNNVVMFCDECLTAFEEEPEPKRKGNLLQRTIDTQNSVISLSTSSHTATPPKTKPNATKPNATNQSMQNAIDLLSSKLEKNTAIISELKSSVDAMHGTITQQKEAVGESIRLNNDNISSIKTSITETHSLIESVKKPSFTNVVKYGNSTRKSSVNETPKSSKSSHQSGMNKVAKPSITGSSSNTIGKPISPFHLKPKRAPEIPEKAIWISRLHRDTTEDEIMSYIKDKLGIIMVEKFQVRKLVKKDRDISTYSFVSFKISCAADLYDTLINSNNWPSTCLIREFELEQKPVQVVKIGEKRSSNQESKNDMSKNETQTHNEMDTA